MKGASNFEKENLEQSFKKEKEQVDTLPKYVFELFRINVSYFEHEDLSEYRNHKVFRLGPESKHIFLKIKVAKYNFKSYSFYFLKCKDSLQDCKSSKVGYFISLHKYSRHKNNAKINKRIRNIL